MIILASLLLVSLQLTGRCETGMQQVPNPNIICMLADDLGYGDIACYNENAKIETPYLDQLADQGMRFTDAHSSSAVCSPTRYALLTGRYNWRSQLQKGVLWYWDEPLIESDRLTIGDLLSNSGYATACIGKWHLGWDWPTRDDAKINDQLAIGQYDKEKRDAFSSKVDFTRPIANGPVTRGFDYYFGDDVPGFPPFCFIENDRTVGLPSQEKPDSLFGYSDGGPMINGWNWKDLLPAITGKAVDYIYAQNGREQFKRARDKPFFLYFSLTAPHVPIVPIEEFKGTSQAGAYGDFVQQIDWSVGQIMEALEKNGLAEKTLLIFTSDNGSPGRDGTNMVGDYNSVTKFGHHPSYIYRGTKTDIWEGGHRIPFIAKWPGVIHPGTICKETICLTDLMATCATIVGKTLPENAGEDSYSLLSIFHGKDYHGQFREATVHHSINGNFSIRKGIWKLVMCSGSGGLSEPRNEAARAQGLPATQLYNLEQDPGETDNLYEKYPETATRLEQLLSGYIKEGRSTPCAPY